MGRKSNSTEKADHRRCGRWSEPSEDGSSVRTVARWRYEVSCTRSAVSPILCPIVAPQSLIGPFIEGRGCCGVFICLRHPRA